MRNGFAILLLLLLTSALSTSCWKVDEDWSLCEPVSPPIPPPPPAKTILVLNFHLKDVPDAQFTDHIDTVDLYLLDEEMNILQTEQFTQAMLEQSLQTTFTDIAPGTYHVVAWANVGGNTQTTLGENILNSYIEINSSETGDPVYYAPYRTPEPHPGDRTGAEEYDYSDRAVNVVAETTTTKDIIFGKAHRTVDVFISGWELSGFEDTGLPVIGRDGAGGRYDYLLRYDATDLRSLSGYTTLQTIEGKEYYVVRFHSALLPLEEYSGHVWLINPHDGAPAPGMLVDLAEYVKANKIIERYGDDTYIPIHFDITGIIDPGDIVPPPPPPPPPPPDDDDPPVIPPVIPPVEGDQNVSVTVGLPPWSDNNITPELN